MLDAIQSLWIGDRLTAMEQMCIRSFLNNGHEFHLYTYSGFPEGLPDGAWVYDANEIIPESQVFKVRDGYSSFSDFFRWKLILDKGGWWCDTDTYCLRPFDFRSDYVFVGGLGKPGTADCVSSGMFKAPKDSTIMLWGWKACQLMDPRSMSWGQAGPPLFTEAVHKFSLQNTIRCGSMFFPVFYTEAPQAFVSTYKPRIYEDAYSIHLFNEMWRLAGQDKDGSYPGSLYEELNNLSRRRLTNLDVL